jgi:hypothetical protein
MTTLLVLITSSIFYAQDYKENWHLGNGVYINDFSGTPTSVSGSSISSFNHATSMSDDVGNLLFYSNSIRIWNSANTSVTGLLGGTLRGSDNTSQGISFQNPADQEQYYYFYLNTGGDLEGRTANSSLYYSIIETDNAPTLTLVTEDEEVFCTGCTGEPFTEAITAVPHCNGLDYWVIVHADEELAVYLVNSTGVYESGVYNFGLESERGNLKASPDGTRLALAMAVQDGDLTLYDFDNTTGVISNQLQLIDEVRDGISFSPNSEILYAVNNLDDELDVYDLNLTTPALDHTVSITRAMLFMQLGNNGKIYANTESSSSSMAVINDPNNLSNCNLDETGLAINFGSTQNSIPNFVDAVRPSTILSATMSGGGNICSTGSADVTVTLTGTAPWDIVYNDGTNNITVTGITSSPYTITANSTGIYTLVSVNSGDCQGVVSGSASVTTYKSCKCGTPISSSTWSTSTPLTPGFYDGGSFITVTGNVTLTDVIMTMSSGGIIYISDGATLTLDHSHIYACGDMWQGIIIEPGGVLNVINGSLIEDAEIAVYIDSPDDDTELHIDNAIFNKNGYGVWIDGYQSTWATTYSNFEIENAVFTCRAIPFASTWPTVASLQVLTGTGTLSEHYTMGGYASTNLKAPHASDISFSAITLLDVGTISGSTYYEMAINGDNGSGTFNLFDNMTMGINADNTNLTCYNNVFQYIIDNSIDGQAINATDLGAGYNTNNRLRVIDDGSGGINTFYDCTIGVKAENYTDVAVSYSDFRSTQMPVSSTPPEGKIGVYIATPNCNQITVDHNTITNIRNGVKFYGDGASASVGGTYYTNAQNLLDVNITDNTIRANYSGVTLTDEYAIVGVVADNLITFTDYILTNPTSEPINVSNNHLYGVHSGISMNNWRYIYQFIGAFAYNYGNRAIAKDNYIELRNRTYPSSGMGQAGVYHTGNYSNYIINNNVQGFGTNSSVWAGIYSDNLSPGTDGNTIKVECNLTENIAFGNYFINPHYNISFKKNEMKTNKFGLMLDNAIIGNQGSSVYASDNTWTGSYPLGTYTTYTQNSSDPTYSNLFVQNTTPYNPTIVGNGCGSFDGPTYTYSYGNGIDYSTYASNLSCDASPTGKLAGTNTSFELFSESDAIGKLEQLVTENGMDYGIYPNEQYINAQHRVYRMLKILPNFKDSSTVLANFYSNKENSNIANLAEVEHTLALGGISNAETFLASINTDNEIEANYKSYYTAYIHFKKRACTPQDSLALWNMATGCASREGDVIHQARSLYNLLYQEDYTIFVDDCKDAENMMNSNRLTAVNTQQYKQESFVVYPNPSNGIINIEVLDNTMLNTSLTIEDVSGKIIYENANFQLNGNIEQLNIKAEDGIYFVKLKDNITSKITVEKIIISNR